MLVIPLSGEPTYGSNALSNNTMDVLNPIVPVVELIKDKVPPTADGASNLQTGPSFSSTGTRIFVMASDLLPRDVTFQIDVRLFSPPQIIRKQDVFHSSRRDRRMISS